MWLAPIVACTAFVMGQGDATVVAKSYDWHLGHGLVLVNKRGVEKRAMTSEPGQRGAEWVSRYASITFNQYGRELPSGGMNEAGLVIEVLWLDDTKYAAADDRPVVNVLQWIQLQLDTHATVAEVAADVERVRIETDNAKVHYMVCDRTAACAAVEVLDGKAVASLGARTLTNDTYASSMRYLERTETVPRGASSLERFARASSLARTAGKDAVAQAFGILTSVAQGDASKWNIVYEPARGRVSWRTLQERKVKTVELRSFDLSCGSPVMMMDIDEPAVRMRAYEGELNRKVVSKSFTDLGLPEAVSSRVAQYPEQLRCGVIQR